MKKEFSKFEIATIKRTAQNVAPLVRKKTKIKEQIAKLQEEYDLLNTQQLQWEQAIINMTNGYATEDLVDKVVETTGTDKDGNPVKTTKYVLKYPDTVVPVMEEEVVEMIAGETFGMCEEPEEIIPMQPVHPIVTESVNWNN